MNKKCMTLIVSTLVSLVTPNLSHAQGNGAAYVGNMDLNLKKAIEIALAENPTIKVADKDIQLKEIADKEAWQALLPSVSASLSLSRIPTILHLSPRMPATNAMSCMSPPITQPLRILRRLPM